MKRNYTKRQGPGAWGQVVGACERCKRNVSKAYVRRGRHTARATGGNGRECGGTVRVDLVQTDFPEE